MLTLRLAAGVPALMLCFQPGAAARQAAAPSPPDQGELLYQEKCALCHQESGSGDQAAFPALSGSDQLDDPLRIVRTIRMGRERMPPFPGLSADEITGLANYVSETWANSPRRLTTEEVVEVLDGEGEAEPLTSIWDGVFTETQADRGEAVYPGACGWCHGHRLDGAPDDPDMRSTPPLARARFLRVWDDRSLATLFEYTRATMPEDNPDSMTVQDYVDVIAYMLTVGGIPAGDAELRPDLQSLARVVIRTESPGP